MLAGPFIPLQTWRCRRAGEGKMALVGTSSEEGAVMAEAWIRGQEVWEGHPEEGGRGEVRSPSWLAFINNTNA